jgi:sporulation protein YlmC with PRC-barrel domain
MAVGTGTRLRQASANGRAALMTTAGGATMRLAATRVRGRKVINYDNEDLGTIEDFMLDTATGRFGYAVLSCAAIAGKQKLFPVPLHALTVDTDGGRFMLNADRETLSYAPGFGPGDWPDTGDPRWKSGVNRFYSF